ncbi:MAG: Rieske (2Fe-2S) protein [Myxococcota bacterium]|nr:Rieske (2Fe-2S) protein [Myxococcota bacterium]
MASKEKKRREKKDAGADRRDFLANAVMGTGLVASHAFAAVLGVRYLYPTRNDRTQRLFVGLRSEIPPGTGIAYEAPGGRTINVIRGQKGFIALSDVCPHLGCRVHFESQTGEFICPCHDGRFDGNGSPLSGPPAEMGAALPRYEVVTDGDMIFLEMSVEVG